MPNKIKDWSRRLGVRLAISFTLLIIIVTAALTYQAVRKESAKLHESLQQRAYIQANTLATSVAAYIVTNDYTTIESILSSAAQAENIRSIQVSDANGRILGDIIKQNDSEIISQYELATITVPQSEKTILQRHADEILVWHPVELGDIVGWVRISFSLEHINATQQRIWFDNIVDGIILVALNLSLLFLLLRKPFRSIRKYTDFADTLDDYQGNILPVDSSSRELDKLGNALNRASLNLQANHTAFDEALTRFEQVAAIADFSPDLIFSIDQNDEIRYLNHRARTVLAETGLNEDSAMHIFPTDFAYLKQQAFISKRAISQVESYIDDRTFSWKFSPLVEQSVLHCHAVEITDKKLAQKALRDSESRYQTLFDSAADAIMLISGHRFIDFNLHATQLFGCQEDDLLRATIRNFLPDNQSGGRDSMVALEQYIDAAIQGKPQFFEWQFKRMDGCVFDTEVSLNVTQVENQQVILAIVRDTTQRKLAEAKLIKQANYDTLTGLPNRILAMDRLSESIKRARRQHKGIAVLFIDVDHFKTVNDSLGHSVGDEMIIEVAKRLRLCVRDGDTTARFGGDEFMIILNDIDEIINAEPVVDKILSHMNAPFFLAGHEFFLGASIGISGFPEDGEEAQVLLRNADAAMYKAKEAGRNTFQYYAPEFNQQAKERMQMEVYLRKALERNELFLTYQPQIDIQSGEIVGAEALIRWQSPELGLVMPDQFIKMAEDTGLIIPIGEWVIRTACEAARDWEKELGLRLRISVNVSQRQFASSDLITQVSKILRETTLDSDLLELEITESLLMDNSDRTLDIIHAFKQLGLTLALDDFGTGYSSLSYLKRFPFDVLKIDRGFVNDITNGIDEAGLCIAILAIASTFHMTVVAEGVENEEQLAFLHSSGANIAQGYHFSKPLADQKFRDFVIAYQDERKRRREEADQLFSTGKII